MGTDGDNLCEDRGIWASCRAGFRRWPDQEQCKYSEKATHRDQCIWCSEMGFCQHLDAQKEARKEPK
jgi:hypothetical protein